MFYSVRTKLVASLVVVSCLAVGVSVAVGGALLFSSIMAEAANRARADVQSVRQIFESRQSTFRGVLTLVSTQPDFVRSIRGGDLQGALGRLGTAANAAEMDFVGFTSRDGGTLALTRADPAQTRAVRLPNPLTARVLATGARTSGVAALDRSFLAFMSPELAEQALPTAVGSDPATPKTPAPTDGSVLVLVAAIPVLHEGELLGACFGGLLLDRNDRLVDGIRDVLFQNEAYDGRPAGAVTVFHGDVRVATNVFLDNGKRALGTRASDEVRRQVFEQGRPWVGRARVVNDWYVAGYLPLDDVRGTRLGMLYAGLREEKYTDVRRRSVLVIGVIAGAGIALVIGLGYLVAQRTMRPVYRLIKASEQVSAGNLSPEIGPISSDEIGVLQKTFKHMLVSLDERDKRSRAESESRLQQSEKQASVGRLAAGVAHEINNPLTGVLTFTHMLLRRADLPDDVREQLQKVAKATDRVRNIVKSLLDFSRQTKLERKPTDMNELIRGTIALMENQALVKGVSVRLHAAEDMPILLVDQSQFQSVLLNVMINALDATPAKGTITISTSTGVSSTDTGHKGVEVTVADTGCGIPAEHMDRLFEPFFTTKEVGQGTGLGLAVSLGIVQRHGGNIRVQSEVGDGTRVFIWLPIERQGEDHEDPHRG